TLRLLILFLPRRSALRQPSIPPGMRRGRRAARGWHVGTDGLGRPQVDCYRALRRPGRPSRSPEAPAALRCSPPYSVASQPTAAPTRRERRGSPPGHPDRACRRREWTPTWNSCTPSKDLLRGPEKDQQLYYIHYCKIVNIIILTQSPL